MNDRQGRTRVSPGARQIEDGTPSRETDVGVEEARRRFGGLDVPATLAGMLVALALAILLGGILGGILGSIGYQTGLKDEVGLSIGGLIGGFVTLLVAFVIGGWAAGRIARYDGGKNGLMTAVWAIVLAALLAGLGAWLGAKYNIFQKVGLPQWFSRNATTGSALVTGLIAIAVMLVAGFLGGLWGANYHRRADAAIVATRRGGVRRAGTTTGRYEIR